jgi:hypothetical protein
MSADEDSCTHSTLLPLLIVKGMSEGRSQSRGCLSELLSCVAPENRVAVRIRWDVHKVTAQYHGAGEAIFTSAPLCLSWDTCEKMTQWPSIISEMPAGLHHFPQMWLSHQGLLYRAAPGSPKGPCTYDMFDFSKNPCTSNCEISFETWERLQLFL